MKGFAKMTLASIIIAIALFVFTSFIYFFPWYSTVIVETFNLAQVVAGENYLAEDVYVDTLERIRDKPIFNKNSNLVKITVLNEDGRSAIGDSNASIYEEAQDEDKPYRQRGNTIEVKIEAVYPLTVTVWGKDISKNIPVSFKMKTVGLKHYKDLDYYFD